MYVCAPSAMFSSLFLTHLSLSIYHSFSLSLFLSFSLSLFLSFSLSLFLSFSLSLLCSHTSISLILSLFLFLNNYSLVKRGWGEGWSVFGLINSLTFFFTGCTYIFQIHIHTNTHTHHHTHTHTHMYILHVDWKTIITYNQINFFSFKISSKYDMHGLKCKSFFQDLDETTNLKSKSTTNNYIVVIDRSLDLNRNRNTKISIQFEPISAKTETSKDT